jgi:alcohol dehydrogenase (cytochrome c)
MAIRSRATTTVFVCVVVASASLVPSRIASAQNDRANIAGLWRAESGPEGRSWTAVLRVDGSRLLGVVSSCTSYPDDVEILEGRVDGSTLSFKCKSPDGARTLTFTGQLNGNRIAFKWIKAGSGSVPYDDAFFGAGAPLEFSATRSINLANPAGPANRPRKAPAVTFEQILHAADTPQDWLTYSGNLLGHRYSPLTAINSDNVSGLKLAWLSQTTTTSGQRATPLVVDGVIYTTRNTNDVVALDAETGRVLWVHPYTPGAGARATGGGGRPNRGLAITDRTLYIGTLDAHLIAIDALTGKPRWDTTVADFKDPSCQAPGRDRSCYVITLAPLIVKDKVLVGLGGGDSEAGTGIRGAILAFDAATGKEVWRFHTIPAPGERGNETWLGDSWRTGGAGVWNTGSYDPDLNLTYWGTGNPSPPGAFGAPVSAVRRGDNLYSASVVALDADTGILKWHYQFTPHDDQDWDAAQVPVLADVQWKGRLRKVMLFANKNGLVYVLDRATGEFLLGQPFVDVNWMSGFDGKNRPIRVNGESLRVSPASATNWFPASHSPRTKLFYIPAWNRSRERGGFMARGPSYGAISAFNPETGQTAWQFKLNDAMFSGGVLTTGSDLLFTGTSGDFFSDSAEARAAQGGFYALDARTGTVLWRFDLPGPIQSPAITYVAGGKQYVAVSTNDTLFAFALKH